MSFHLRGHRRRAVFSYTPNGAPAGSQSTGVGLTMDYSDYGPQPRPAVPPADQVEDVGALAASLGGR